jgi:hypothetical protein
MIVKNDRRQFLKIAGLGALAITLGVKSKPNPNWVSWGNIREIDDAQYALQINQMLKWIGDTIQSSIWEDEPITLEEFKEIGQSTMDLANRVQSDFHFALQFNPEESAPLEERYVFNVVRTLRPPSC